MNIVQEVRKVSHHYAAKGGSDNRRQQVARMISFVEFARNEGANSLGQVGKNHVVKYWKSHRNLSDATLYNHWRALAILWKLTDKAGEPPKPRLGTKAKEQSLNVEAAMAQAAPNQG